MSQPELTGTPVLILRETTERPEIVHNGLGFLVGTDEEKIISSFDLIYEDRSLYEGFSLKTNPFGDGKACERLLHFLNIDEVQAFIKDYPHSSERALHIKEKRYFENF